MNEPVDTVTRYQMLIRNLLTLHATKINSLFKRKQATNI
ncbi:hypothetical protein V6x_41880 [Gimesia chilikensis]|uniref:Uncharacterized protein n=1 Tax=Gimesia chilikensis TaxID=2605989 RepID=A0A517WGR9_9PLAN|nr:hypothetical protein V6x_41880 [Gimesia chilikensis]